MHTTVFIVCLECLLTQILQVKPQAYSLLCLHTKGTYPPTNQKDMLYSQNTFVIMSTGSWSLNCPCLCAVDSPENIYYCFIEGLSFVSQSLFTHVGAWKDTQRCSHMVLARPISVNQVRAHTRPARQPVQAWFNAIKY